MSAGKGRFMHVEQFVMAYGVEQDRLHAGAWNIYGAV